MLNAVIIYIWHRKRTNILCTELGSGDNKSGYNSFNSQKRGKSLIFFRLIEE